MSRTLTFLAIPENRHAAILHLADTSNDPRNTDEDRLVLIRDGTVFVEIEEGRIFIGPGCTHNAVRVSAGLRVGFVPAMSYQPTLHTVVGTTQINAVLAPDGKGPWKVPEGSGHSAIRT